MNTKTVVVLVALGALIAVGGKTAAVKTGGAIKSAYTHTVHSKPAHVAAKPFVWTAKRLAK